MNQQFQITFDLTPWFGEFQRDMDAALSDMLQLCNAAESQSYSDENANRVGTLHIVLTDPATLGASAPQRAARSCFISSMGKFSSFLDRMIATQRVKQGGVPIVRQLVGQEEVFAYVNSYLEEKVTEVAHEFRLTMPKKIDCFPGVDPPIREMALSYNRLRNHFEHHHDKPADDLELSVRRLATFLNKNEVVSLPAYVHEGDVFALKLITHTRLFPRGTKIVLDPRDAYDLIFTIRNVVAPAMFQACVGGAQA